MWQLCCEDRQNSTASVTAAKGGRETHKTQTNKAERKRKERINETKWRNKPIQNSSIHSFIHSITNLLMIVLCNSLHSIHSIQFKTRSKIIQFIHSIDDSVLPALGESAISTDPNETPPSSNASAQTTPNPPRTALFPAESPRHLRSRTSRGASPALPPAAFDAFHRPFRPSAARGAARSLR